MDRKFVKLNVVLRCTEFGYFESLFEIIGLKTTVIWFKILMVVCNCYINSQKPCKVGQKYNVEALIKFRQTHKWTKILIAVEGRNSHFKKEFNYYYNTFTSGVYRVYTIFCWQVFWSWLSLVTRWRKIVVFRRQHGNVRQRCARNGFVPLPYLTCVD